MASVYDVASTFAARVKRRDDLARARVAAIYGQIQDETRDELTALLGKIARTGELTAAALYRRDRLETLLRTLERRIARAAAPVGTEIRAARRAAVDLGAKQAEKTLLSIDASFVRAPVEALEAQIGFLGDGSPLRATLERLGPLASERMERSLLDGVAQGRSPRDIAAVAVRESDVARPKALTIARTETLRSYRSASLENYRANADVVSGWVWLAELDADTCPVCWAMHGTVHGLEEEFGSHPQCRCSPSPLVPGVEAPARGVDLFEQLPEPEQQQVLGPASYELYRQGRLGLEDLVGYRDDPDWGPVRYRRSLEAIGARRAA